MPKKFTPDQISMIINASKTNNLITPDTMSNDLVGGNEGNKRLNSGLVGELFDLLGRTSSASAGGVLAAQKGEDVWKGVKGGLTGKEHHSYSEVLDEAGVTNPIVKAAGGFAGDVLLDPLTYVGIKGNKGIKGQEAAYKGVQEVTAALAGEAVTDKVFMNAAEEAVARIEKENPSHLYATFAGVRFTPKVKAPSKVGNALKDAIIGKEETRAGNLRELGEHASTGRKIAQAPRKLSTMFSRESEYGMGLAEPTRLSEIQTQIKFARHQQGIQDLTARLTMDEGRRVSLAIEQDQDLTGVNFTRPDMQKHAARLGVKDLEDVRQAAKLLMKSWWDDGVRLGINNPEDYLPNYVPQYLKKPPPELMPGLATSERIRLRVKSTVRKYSIEHAEKLGYEPMTHIGEILQQRAMSNYRKIGRSELVYSAVKHAGVKMTPENKGFLEAGDWVPVAHNISDPVGKSADLTDYYVPHPVARTINATSLALKDTTAGTEMMKLYDKGMYAWKSLSTMTPGFIARNALGDFIQNAADGVVDYRRYVQSARVMNSVKDIDSSVSLMDDLLGRVGSRAAAKPSGKFVNIGGKNMPVEEIYNRAMEHGVDTGQLTDLGTNRLKNQGMAKFRQNATFGTAQRKFMDKNNTREVWQRLAHFIDVLDKRVGDGLTVDKAAEEAGVRVRKFNIDYGAKSNFERKTMSRAMPFYSWFRLNTPLQFKLLLTRPGFMAAYGKGGHAIQTLLAADDGSEDYMASKWIRDSMPVRLAQANVEGNWFNKAARFATGAGKADAVFLPLMGGMTPIGDLGNITSPIQRGMEAGPWQGAREGGGVLGNMLGPAFKAPAEAITGTSMFTGNEIQDWKQWGLQQTGVVGKGINASGQLGGESNARSNTSALTGISMQPITEQRQKGEFRRREDVLRAQIKHEKIAGLQAMGWPVTEQTMKRFNTEKTARLAAYLRLAEKSVETSEQ